MQQAKARVTSTGAVLMGAGGLIALIGSVLPWAKFSLRTPLLGGALSQSVAGTSTGEGKAVLVMSIIAIAAAVLVAAMPRRQLVMAMGIVVIVAALVVSFLTIRDIGQKDQQIHDALEKESGQTLTDAQVQEFLNRFGITISLSAGIYLAMLGGLVMLGGGIATITTAPKEEGGSSFDAGRVSAAPTYSPLAPPEVVPPTMPAPPAPAPEAPHPDPGPDPGVAPA
jgi:hypothetical protein